MGKKKETKVVSEVVPEVVVNEPIDINNPKHGNLITHPSNYKETHLVKVAREVSKARKG